ncbi:hypothetical protein IVG45_04060 [Methylomonas sp. LL1]|uniref:hypothetical protein n=1 Tax=Methylomonas sp. LL1 TaxID=2785785 RepID=UPI0018C3D91F|nr:hypothetical protein [Methylomonas sp. LL1]QPK64156.1 hypothetical protein IVG45_04060 [Methylomonas sp. LL1]
MFTSTFARLACMALFMLLLAACSGFRFSPPDPEEQSEKLAELMEKGGYAPASGLAIESSRDIWNHDRTELEVVMTAPTLPGRYPLIIYLPGLGEEAKAGHLWRETWAKAGYAVFSMQPLTIARALKDLPGMEGAPDGLDDEEPGLADPYSMEPPEDRGGGWLGEKRRRPSRTARNSEMHYLGHEYFSPDNLKNRMEQLFWAYRQLKARAGKGLPLFASVDFSKVVLAGYDLGAQTVTAALGENFETALPDSGELKPIAGLVLSPSVNLAMGNVRSRYQALNPPLLVITGTEDNDPYAISSGAVRTAVWEYAPAGGKYLLLLKEAGHRILAGSEMGGRFGRDEPDGFGGGSSGGGGRSGGPRGPGGMNGEPGAARRVRDPELGYKHVAAVFSASTAFLDAVVKNDEFARFWLDDKGNKWLGKAGSLRIR